MHIKLLATEKTDIELKKKLEEAGKIKSVHVSAAKFWDKWMNSTIFHPSPSLQPPSRCCITFVLRQPSR